MAYAEQDGGSDWRTIRVLDVKTGESSADMQFMGSNRASDQRCCFATAFRTPPRHGAIRRARSRTPAIVPPLDMRGYGRSYAPDAADRYSAHRLRSGRVLDALDIDKPFSSATTGALIVHRAPL
ncbi:hypothetical protein [Sphingobium sp.]|uniref:hypothetical protein n=1 Tax=Sphingobium sp. TaxID=1912891 RepID=UPI002C4BFBEA|nr:hypothetical protein [Sphingobium sp.]HUD94362.1 hypothetical protein [Sphingobium sp.]